MFYYHLMQQIYAMLHLIAIFIVIVSNTQGEQYNLYGEPDHGYIMQVNIGHPYQTLNLLVDTGSTTLAVASTPRKKNDEYFHMNNSSSINDSGKCVQERYTQGNWSGILVSDLVQVPSLRDICEVRSDIAVITRSYKFFMNESIMQGIIGMAYKPDTGSDTSVVAETYLDAVDRARNKQMLFQMKLCGPWSTTNTTHYGRFKMLDDDMSNDNHNIIYRTPVLKKRLYEVAVISVRLMISIKTLVEHNIRDPDIDMCRNLNAVRSIIDSGTTNIRLPDAQFRKLVDEIKGEYQKSHISIDDLFWYQGKTVCWPEPQKWPMLWLAIDLLSSNSDNQYFTLELPPQNYMRAVFMNKTSDVGGKAREYCYQLGLEPGGNETVLGYTAMEGYEVLFNRAEGWVGFQISDCGPAARITGPHNASTSLRDTCKLLHTLQGHITAALRWAVIIILMFAAAFVIFLLRSRIKTLCERRCLRLRRLSLSAGPLVD